MHQPDVVVIGGGIAGVSVGHELVAAGFRVVLLEAEATLAYHTTGRSAAQYLETYGNEAVRRLTKASRPFFEEPDPELADGALWHPRPLLRAGRAEHLDHLRAEAVEFAALVPSVELVDRDAARDLFPPLRADVAGALLEPEAMELDVAAIHQTFVRGLRRGGGEIHRSSRVTSLEPLGGGWRVTAGGETFDTAVVVNAAGAWGDRIGELAGADPLGLHPLRRTVAVGTVPTGFDPAEVAAWPLVTFAGHGGGMDGYCKPEPGGLLVSPADETPSPPCDAKPDEIDVARALDALARWTTIEVRHVSSTWAGLRSFMADRTPVVGFDPDLPGFFWLIGQGGYGIHISPALARLSAALIAGRGLPPDLVAHGVSADVVAPNRSGLDEPLGPGH